MEELDTLLDSLEKAGEEAIKRGNLHDAKRLEDLWIKLAWLAVDMEEGA